MPDGVGGGVPLSLLLLSGDRAVARRRPSSRIARRRKYSMKRAVCSSSPPSFCSVKQGCDHHRAQAHWQTVADVSKAREACCVLHNALASAG